MNSPGNGEDEDNDGPDPAGLGPLDDAGQETAQVVADVEEQEAGHRDKELGRPVALSHGRLNLNTSEIVKCNYGTNRKKISGRLGEKQECRLIYRTPFINNSNYEIFFCIPQNYGRNYVRDWKVWGKTT